MLLSEDDAISIDLSVTSNYALFLDRTESCNTEYQPSHAGEAIIMLLGNYENLNDQCVSFTINFEFID